MKLNLCNTFRCICSVNYFYSYLSIQHHQCPDIHFFISYTTCFGRQCKGEASSAIYLLYSCSIAQWWPQLSAETCRVSDKEKKSEHLWCCIERISTGIHK